MVPASDLDWSRVSTTGLVWAREPQQWTDPITLYRCFFFKEGGGGGGLGVIALKLRVKQGE